MPGFDPALDKELYSEEKMIGNNKLTVKIMSYNDGEAKLQIGRERVNKDGEPTFAKLGRLTLEEITEIMPLLEKGKQFMETK